MMPDSFTHLHVHTEYSMLDGAAKIDALIAEAKRLGMSAVAMTDHGNMFGAYAFYQAAKAAGIKPIIGLEAYVAPVDRFTAKPAFWGHPGQRDDDVSAGGAYTHMTLLARDAGGLRNLFRLSSLASIEGFYRKPRVDRELLARYSEGVIATTGCASGEVQTRIRLGQRNEALRAATELRDIFGAGNFYLELMDHGINIERRARNDLLSLGRVLSLPPLATNDSHYVTRDQAAAHEILLCVQAGKTLDDPARFRFDGDGYYLKSPAEMRALWADLPYACDNTMVVADSVEDYGEVFAHRDLMPRADIPAGETAESWLRAQTFIGMKARFPGTLADEYLRRVEYELSVIINKGFAGYFLVVADIVAHARSQGIAVGPGRGSATGCMVSYALGITALDPIEHGLLFERMLNPERESMPDIDLDFDERRRGDMIRYVTEKYGSDHVCQIITFNQIKAKAALKDAGRVLGQPYAVGDKLTKAFPPMRMGRDINLATITDPGQRRYGEASAIRDLLRNDPQAQRVYDAARGIEGLIRQAGVHAAGIIISSEPLLDTLPIWQREDGSVVSGWDYGECDAIGLLKMDFLGLRNLSVIEEAVANVRRNHDPHFALSVADRSDTRTYELLARGDTLGVFQLDALPIRQLLQAMAPTEFADIVAVIALYRPGPMGANAHNDYADRKNGRKPIVAIHPELGEPLSDILGDTYGLIVYQEQVLAIAQRVAGYSIGRADMLRRAMGKKKREVLDREFAEFQRGMQAGGYSANAIKTLWTILMPFADYAFAKCVSGDTTISRLGRGSVEWTQTVRDIANRVHGREDYDGTGCRYCYNVDDRPIYPRSRECQKCKPWRAKWRMSGGINAAGRVGDRVLPVKITDVFRQGVQPVWRVTLENGMSVTSTANHRHLTPDGWRQVDELSVGDHVSIMLPVEMGQSRPHGRNAEFNRNTVALERRCAHCGSTDPARGFNRARLDGNAMNNAADNLAILCNSCHLKHDYGNGGHIKKWRKGRRIDSCAIAAIEYVGEEMTYDVTVDSDDHSWIANDGIVTHNSHSSGYAMLSYWTAYLKANYPAEYMAALLTSVGDDKTKMALYLAECRRLGISVLSPDVNASVDVFVAEKGTIRFGLGAVRNVGTNVVAAIEDGRRDGPYTGFYDFLARVGSAACNKKAVESLIKAGAFDSMGHTRRGLMAVHADAIDGYADVKKQEALGQFDLFGMFDDEDDAPQMVSTPVIPGYEWAKPDLLALEREMLGMYVSNHPLFGMERALEAAADASVADVLDSAAAFPDGATIKLAGILSDVTRKLSKSGSAYATAALEDLTGSADLLVFSSALEQMEQWLHNDGIVVAKCRIDRGEDQPRLIVVGMGAVGEPPPEPEVLTLTLNAAQCSAELVETLRSTLAAHPGGTEVRLRLKTMNTTVPLRIARRVERSPDLLRSLESLLGRQAVN